MNRAHTSSAILVALILGLLLVPERARAQGGAMRSLDGQSVTLADLRGRPSVLLFGGIVDPQSQDELPMLQRLADRYGPRGVAVYWVSVDPEKAGVSGAVGDADLASFAARHGYRGAVLRDPAGEAFRALASTGRRAQVPTIVILDRTGAPAAPPIGGFDREADMVNRIAGVLDRLDTP